MRLYSVAVRVAGAVTRSVASLFFSNSPRSLHVAHSRFCGSPVRVTVWTHADAMERGKLHLGPQGNGNVFRHRNASGELCAPPALLHPSESSDSLAASSSDLSMSTASETSQDPGHAVPIPAWASHALPSVSGLKRSALGVFRRDVKGKRRAPGPSVLATLSRLAADSIARLFQWTHVFKFDPHATYDACMELSTRASEEHLRKRGAPGECSKSAIAFTSAHSHLPLTVQARLYGEWLRWHDAHV